MKRDETTTVIAHCPTCKGPETHIQMDNGKFVCKRCLMFGRAVLTLDK